MNEKELEQIREWEAYQRTRRNISESHTDLDHTAKLLTEVDRLKAENTKRCPYFLASYLVKRVEKYTACTCNDVFVCHCGHRYIEERLDRLDKFVWDQLCAYTDFGDDNEPVWPSKVTKRGIEERLDRLEDRLSKVS